MIAIQLKLLCLILYVNEKTLKLHKQYRALTWSKRQYISILVQHWDLKCY